MIAEFTSDLILILIFLDAIRNLYKRSATAKNYITSLVFLLGISLTLKLIFRIPRNYIDPFSFPSTHTMLSFAPYFAYKDKRFLILPILVGSLRILAGVHSYLDIAGGLIFGYLSVFLLDKVIGRVGKEAHRKAFHIGLASTIGYLLYLFRYYTILLLVITLIGGFILFLLRNKLSYIRLLLEWYDRDFTARGAFTLVLGILIAAVLWDKAYVSALALAWIDGLATIFGKMFKTKQKSLYGLVGGTLGAFIVYLASNFNIILLLITAIIEYLSPKYLDDNIVVPLSPYILYKIYKMI